MGMESVLARAKTVNLFGNPIDLLARQRARELLFPRKCLEAALAPYSDQQETSLEAFRP